MSDVETILKAATEYLECAGCVDEGHRYVFTEPMARDLISLCDAITKDKGSVAFAFKEEELRESRATIARLTQEREAAYAHHGEDPLGIELMLARAKVERLETALTEAHVMFGAAIISAGGQLRVSRKAIVEVDRDGVLSSWAEPDGVVYTYHAALTDQEDTTDE